MKGFAESLKQMSYMGIPGLKHFYNKKECVPSVYIEQAVMEHFGIGKVDLVSKSRAREVLIPRHILMFLLRKYTRHTLKVVAKMYNRDHSSAIHSCRNVQDMIDTDPLFEATIQNIEAAILLKFKMSTLTRENR